MQYLSIFWLVIGKMKVEFFSTIFHTQYSAWVFRVRLVEQIVIKFHKEFQIIVQQCGLEPVWRFVKRAPIPFPGRFCGSNQCQILGIAVLRNVDRFLRGCPEFIESSNKIIDLIWRHDNSDLIETVFAVGLGMEFKVEPAHFGNLSNLAGYAAYKDFSLKFLLGHAQFMHFFFWNWFRIPEVPLG